MTVMSMETMPRRDNHSSYFRAHYYYYWIDCETSLTKWNYPFASSLLAPGDYHLQYLLVAHSEVHLCQWWSSSISCRTKQYESENTEYSLRSVLLFESYRREFLFRQASAFVTHERWETNAEQKHVQHRMKEKRWLSRNRPACFFPSLSHASRLFCSFRRERLEEATFSCFLFFVNKVNKAHEWTERKSARIKTQ